LLMGKALGRKEGVRKGVREMKVSRKVRRVGKKTRELARTSQGDCDRGGEVSELAQAGTFAEERDLRKHAWSRLPLSGSPTGTSLLRTLPPSHVKSAAAYYPNNALLTVMSNRILYATLPFAKSSITRAWIVTSSLPYYSQRRLGRHWSSLHYSTHEDYLF
jgi:hypothetical protein